MKEKLENYRYAITTEIKWRDEWHPIHEVWFIEKKIGLKDTGHIIDYDEVQDIRN